MSDHVSLISSVPLPHPAMAMPSRRALARLATEQVQDAPRHRSSGALGHAPSARHMTSAAPHTIPHAPPSKPSERPVPERTAPEPQPQRRRGPFQPEWPKTRPTPEQKALLRA
jgi:hypothetical protein